MAFEKREAETLDPFAEIAFVKESCLYADELLPTWRTLERVESVGARYEGVRVHLSMAFEKREAETLNSFAEIAFVKEFFLYADELLPTWRTLERVESVGARYEGVGVHFRVEI
jgi:hypothetical protein